MLFMVGMSFTGVTVTVNNLVVLADELSVSDKVIFAEPFWSAAGVAVMEQLVVPPPANDKLPLGMSVVLLLVAVT
jgi:hypothetical protein